MEFHDLKPAGQTIDSLNEMIRVKSTRVNEAPAMVFCLVIKEQDIREKCDSCGHVGLKSDLNYEVISYVSTDRLSDDLQKRIHEELGISRNGDSCA